MAEIMQAQSCERGDRSIAALSYFSPLLPSRDVLTA
jgi:hypothetical protein